MSARQNFQGLLVGPPCNQEVYEEVEWLETHRLASYGMLYVQFLQVCRDALGLMGAAFDFGGDAARVLPIMQE